MSLSLSPPKWRTDRGLADGHLVMTTTLMALGLLCFQDERGRLMRRNIVRYAVLAYVITLNHVSVRVKKRFPGWQHMVDAGKAGSPPAPLRAGLPSAGSQALWAGQLAWCGEGWRGGERLQASL